MSVLNKNITDALRKDAEMIKKLNKECRNIKDTYKPELAAKKMTDLIGEKIPDRKLNAEIIIRQADEEFKRVKKEHEMQYLSEKHQLAISNILKLLELSNYNVDNQQLENLLAPLDEANDYSTLSMLSHIFEDKGNMSGAGYCAGKAGINEVENAEQMTNAIKDYINTDMLTAVGGDPTKYKNSSYEEILLTAQKLGFDINGLEKAYSSDEIIADINAFSNRQIGAAMGIAQEEPIFNNIQSSDPVAQQVESAIGVN